MDARILALANELAGRGEPFVLATVVWRRGPSSGQIGGTALIDAEGRLHGWLGGACAQPAVLRAARGCLVTGSPKLMFLGPDEDLAERTRAGVETVPIACDSEGALEIHLEPVMPAQHLVVVGRSPAVTALLTMAAALGWRVGVVDESTAGPDLPADALVTATPDLASHHVGPGSVVVVATQGASDEEALEQALATPAAYVGLVASKRRAASVLGYLRQRGVDDEALARVHAPAGLDLGHTRHQEIAVAILAQIVALRTTGKLAGTTPAAVPEPATALDPVCGMAVEVEGARHVTQRDTGTWYFCCAGCQAKFEATLAR